MSKIITPRQLAANRRNAQSSTGPRTLEGKAASRFNALRHGLAAECPVIPGENAALYETLRDAFLDQYRPATA
ncbi:MAG: hypothetical protein HYS04_01825, partial [Acidobacteria bacterium]|nr:hypothetical protein [Acidobacteriota bacterium]